MVTSKEEKTTVSERRLPTKTKCPCVLPTTKCPCVVLPTTTKCPCGMLSVSDESLVNQHVSYEKHVKKNGSQCRK